MSFFYKKTRISVLSLVALFLQRTGMNRVMRQLRFVVSCSGVHDSDSNIPSYINKNRKWNLCFLFSFFLLITGIVQAQNPIVTENALAGNPISQWGVPSFRDVSINGFSTEIGVNKGQTVRFKINVQGAATYTLQIYRIGYYAGNGARLVASLGTLTGISQPAGISDAVTGYWIVVTGQNLRTGMYPLQRFRVFTLQNSPEQAAAAIILLLLLEMMQAIQIFIFKHRMPPGRHTMVTAVIMYTMEQQACRMVMPPK